MTAENEMETHPLDRDYSQPVRTRAPMRTIEYFPKLRRVGLFTFAAGFATVFLAAIVQGSSRRGGPLGYSIHHLAMVIILVGGILIILAYRVPHLKHLKARPGVKKREARRNEFQRFGLLVFWNVVGFLAIVLVGFLLHDVASQTLMILVHGAMTVTCALLVTIAVWHRGLFRAYAIGVLVALLMNNFMSIFALTGGYWLHGDIFPLLGHLVTIQTSGLACAGYVCLMKPAGSRRASDREESPP